MIKSKNGILEYVRLLGGPPPTIMNQNFLRKLLPTSEYGNLSNTNPTISTSALSCKICSQTFLLEDENYPKFFHVIQLIHFAGEFRVSL